MDSPIARLLGAQAEFPTFWNPSAAAQRAPRRLHGRGVVATSPAPAQAGVQPAGSAATATSPSAAAMAATTVPRHILTAGAMAGCTEILATFPLEFTKTQLQLGKQKYQGIWDCMRHTAATKGVTGLYRGMSPWLFFAQPKVAVRMTVFEGTKSRALENGAPDAPLTTLACGLFAGAIEAMVVGVPMNTLSVRMVDDSNREVPKYRNGFAAVKGITQEEGIGGLWRHGMRPLMLKMAVNQGTRFLVYSQMRPKIENALGGSYSGQQSTTGTWQGFMASLIAGGMGGTISVLMTHPLDTIKTRLQGLDAAQYEGSAIKCARTIVRQGGPRAFYYGILPRLIRVTCEASLQLTLFHTFAELLDEVW